MGALPPTFKNAANPLVHEQMQAQFGMDAETDEIRKAEREQVRERTLEDYNISTMDTAKAESTGRIGSGASAIAQREEMARKQEQRNKENTDLQVQMAAMRELQQTIDTANDAIAAGKKVLVLMENDELDRNNPEHRKIMIEAGLDPDDPDLTADDVRRKIEENEQIKSDAQRDLDAMQEMAEVHEVEARSERQDKFKEARVAEAEITELDEFNVDDLLGEIDGMSFADEVEPSPIQVEASLKGEFDKAATGAPVDTPATQPILEADQSVDMSMNL